jgi:MFS family permease
VSTLNLLPASEAPLDVGWAVDVSHLRAAAQVTVSFRHVGADRRNVAAVAVLLTCVSGFGFYSLTIYAEALTHAFGLSTVSRANSVLLITTGLAGTTVGSLLGRVDIRAVLAGGSLLMATGIALLGRVDSDAGLFGTYVLLGLGQAGTGVVPGLSLVSRWFGPDRRPAAMTVASTGLSVGGIAVAPLVAFSLHRNALSSVTTVAALVFLGVTLLAVTLVTPHPTVGVSDLPLLVDGRSRDEAVRTRAFWAVSAAQTCATLAQLGGLTHLFALVTERGSTTVAGEAISAVAIGSLSGRFLGSLLLSRISVLVFYRLLLALQSVMLGLLAVESGTLVLLLSSAVFGFTIGNVLLSHPLLLGELFGQRDFPRVLALSTLIATAGTAGGPVLVGQLRASTGHWYVGYLAAAAASAVGAVLLTTLVSARDRQSESERVSQAGVSLR